MIGTILVVKIFLRVSDCYVHCCFVWSVKVIIVLVFLIFDTLLIVSVFIVLKLFIVLISVFLQFKMVLYIYILQAVFWYWGFIEANFWLGTSGFISYFLGSNTFLFMSYDCGRMVVYVGDLLPCSDCRFCSFHRCVRLVPCSSNRNNIYSLCICMYISISFILLWHYPAAVATVSNLQITDWPRHPTMLEIIIRFCWAFLNKNLFTGTKMCVPNDFSKLFHVTLLWIIMCIFMHMAGL